jgi:hypothetical protein
LHQAFAITQINKNDTAMIPTAVYPAAQAHGLAHLRL